MISNISNTLFEKYTLPQSYIDFISTNPTDALRGKSIDDVEIYNIFNFDQNEMTNIYSMNKLMTEEWGYPEGYVYICDSPSAGHDMIALDYSECGPNGEPKVVHIDQDMNYKITKLAEDFTEFIKVINNS